MGFAGRQLDALQPYPGAAARRDVLNGNGFAAEEGRRAGRKPLLAGMHRHTFGEIQRRQDAQAESVFARLGFLIPAGCADGNQGLQIGDAHAIVGEGERIRVDVDVNPFGLRPARVLQQFAEHRRGVEGVAEMGDETGLMGLETNGVHGNTPWKERPHGGKEREGHPRRGARVRVKMPGADGRVTRA